METEKTIYAGSGKTSKNPKFLNLAICLTDLPKEHIYEYKGKKYINLTVITKDAPDQYGKTHSVTVNTFKPTKKQDDNLPY